MLTTLPKHFPTPESLVVLCAIMVSIQTSNPRAVVAAEGVVNPLEMKGSTMVRILESSCGVTQGMTFGKWSVAGKPFSIGTRQYCVVAICECNRVAVIHCNSLSRGKSLNCRHCKHPNRRRHGETGTAVHQLWKGMRQRCQNPNSESYANYGGRGISVCNEWQSSYENFREWALANGYQHGLEIDRINNDGDYCPTNCRFATSKVNSRNKRSNVILHAFGESKTVADWADDSRCTVTYHALWKRLRRGIAPEAAINSPQCRGSQKVGGPRYA